MDEKEPVINQVQDVTPVGQGMQPSRSHPKAEGTGFGSHGGARAGAGRPKGVPNKITNTFRDVLLQAVSEVGDSQEVGKDGQGGLLGFLKICSVLERKTTLLLLGRILPLKINAEVKQVKNEISLEDAVLQLKELGLDEALAFYLKRYPVAPDEKDTEFAKLIDLSLAPDDPLAAASEDDGGNNGTGK
jgi:hypothetical protein